MRAIRIFGRNVLSAVKSIFRNFSLSVASIVCTTITLVIVAIAILLSTNIREFTNDLEGSLTIVAYVERNATEDEINTIKSKLLEIKNIKGDENNPLQAEYIITVKDIEELSETVESVKKIPNIANVKYNDEVVDKMVPIFKTIEKIAIAIIIGLVAVTIFLICNTIKLTIYARKNEIEIMRLVGISNFVIKLPFAIEGLFLGIIGAIVPIVTTIWGYTVVYDKLEGHLFTNFIKMLQPFPFTLYVSGILLLIGAIVGMVGSYATVRRHLKI